MKMRRGWPENMPAEKITELQHILGCLQMQMQFEMAVLYGRCAGGAMQSKMGGYELLLVTPNDPESDGWRLEEYLEAEYPAEARAEPMIHIETVNIYYLNNINTTNWFFWNIRMEGTIVYDCGNAVHGFFKSVVFKHLLAYRAARRSYDYFFTNGCRMLDDAERMWAEKKRPQVAFMLSYAALFLLRAEETVFFGYLIRTGNMQKIFRRARHFSKALAEEFESTDRCDAEFLDKLHNLRHAPRNHEDFKLSESRYRFYLERLRKMQAIVRDSCQRHLSYLEHSNTKKQWMDLSHLDVESSEPIQESPDSIPIPEPAPATTPDSSPAPTTDSTSAETETHAEPEDAQKTEPTHRITVEVDPTIAVIALGLAKGSLPSLIEQLEARSGLRMDSDRRQQMIDTLDAIYDRCIEKADLREVVGLFMRLKRDDILS